MRGPCPASIMGNCCPRPSLQQAASCIAVSRQRRQPWPYGSWATVCLVQPHELTTAFTSRLTDANASTCLPRLIGYFLLATMSFFLIPAILNSGIPPSHAARILRTFFGVLAIADITHVGIATSTLPLRERIEQLWLYSVTPANAYTTSGQIVCTLIDLKHLAFRPATWNTLAHGEPGSRASLGELD